MLLDWLSGARWAVIAAVVAGAAAWHWTSLRTAYKRGGEHARLELAENRAEISRLIARGSEAARAEEQRRTERQRKADDATSLELAALRAAVDRERAAGVRMRKLAAAHAGTARGVAADPTATRQCQATARAAVVYAELYRLVIDAAGRMAETADDRGVRGTGCERAGR